MFALRSFIVNVLVLFYLMAIVMGNSNEENGKDVELEGIQIPTTEETLKEDIKEEVKEEEKEAEAAQELEEELKQSATEAESVLIKEEIKELEKLHEMIEEAEKATEVSISKTEETPEKAEEEELSEHSSEIPKETVSEENVEIPTTAPPMLDKETTVEKEEAPEDTFAVWNSKGKICLLAKLNATFSIIYPSKGGEEKAEIHVPKHGNSKGKCESTSRTPVLQISWEKKVLTLNFNKSDEENWVLSSMELTYDTSESLFDRATNAGKKTARSKSLNIFETPVGKSYYCPAQEVVLLYTANKKVVTARLFKVYLQPYAVEDGKFSPVHRCNKVVIDGLDETPFVQDETVPLAVGCTLALITLFILIGFSVHRAYNAAKVDYNNME